MIVSYMTTGGPGIIDQNSRAFLWTQANGVQDLHQVLAADGLGTSVTGWTLTEATAITPDGNTIVGNGIDPQGHQEAWIVNLSSAPPSPPSTRQTPTITWAKPADIVYGTALSGAQLDAKPSVPGTLIYSPSFGTVLTVGEHSLSVQFTPSDSTDYTTAPATVAINMEPAPAPPTLVIRTKTVVTAAPRSPKLGRIITLTATVTTPGRRGGTPSGSVAFFDGTTMLGPVVPIHRGKAILRTSILSAGSHKIRAKYLGSGAFAPSDASVSVTVGA
jgi:hypothetical protein